MKRLQKRFTWGCGAVRDRTARLLALTAISLVALTTFAGCGRPGGTLQMPAQKSTLAPEVDELYYFIFWVSVVFFVGIVGTMLVFVVKYRRRKGHKATPTGHHFWLEMFWTFTPLLLLAVFFHMGFKSYMNGAVPPADALEIRVRASQWQWEFEYPNGTKQMNELTVPLNRPVKLVLSSSDVLHSFFVPEFRIKRDAVPGMYTQLWFEATEVGDVQVLCAEYCGAPPGVAGNVGHSNMRATIHVVEGWEPPVIEAPEDCKAKGDESLVAACWGEALYTKNGCLACHGNDGVRDQPAPNLRGLWGRTEEMVDGTSVEIDANYLRESILEPGAKIVTGYEAVAMPPFRLEEAELDALIAYIRSLESQE